MAAAAILKVRLLATTGPLLHIFTPNLTRWLKFTSHSQIFHENSHIAKIQDGGRRYFEIS